MSHGPTGPDTAADRLSAAILDGLTTQVAVLDCTGEITITNAAYRDFTRLGGAAPRARPDRGNLLAWFQAAHGEAAEHRHALAEGLREVLEGIRPAFTLEYRCPTLGHDRWLLVRASVLPDDPDRRVIVAFDEVTERKRTEEALRLQVRRAEVLLELPRLADQYDEKRFLQRGMELTEELTGSTISFVHFLNAGEEEIELVAWSRRTLEQYCSVAYDSHYPVSRAGIWADALRQRQPVIVNDYAGHPAKHGLPEGHSPLQRLISVPVIEDGRVVMLAGVGNKASDYTAFDTESVELVATTMWQIARNARAQAATRETAAQFERLARHVPGALYQFELRPDGTARIPYASLGIADVYGLRPDEVEGDAGNAFEVIHPGDLPEVQRSIRESAETLTRWRNQHRVILPDGRLIWVEGESSPERQPDGTVVWHGYIRDITERRAAESRLRTLTQAVEQSDVTIVITDADGTITYANPHFERTTGYTLAEAIGQNPRILKSGDTPPETYRELWDTLLTGREWRGQLRNRRKDGSTYLERVVISPVREADGTITNFVAVKEDITEERRREEQQAALQVQLEHAQKMQSVGRLAGGIAHDFNNLLTVISATLELTLSANHLPEAAHADLLVVQDAARRAMVLTRQLLTFSRQNVVTAREVSVNEVVTRMLGMLSRMVGEDVTLLEDCADDAGVVSVDVGQLEQLLTNLAVNARDAMPRGGRITMATARVRLADGEQPNLPAGEYVRVTVADTGTGMSDEVKARIFDPFFTTKAIGKGTGLGLGLAIVYGVAAQSGGAVSVETTLGEGSAFHVYLPRLEAGTPTPVEDRRHQLVPGEGVILVVDDEPALGTVAKRILERAGYTVLLAHRGEEAIRLFERSATPVDLLLTDVIMPDMGGPELATVLRSREPDLRVLFASGYSGDILSHHGLDEQHYGFLAKPFTIPELTRRVHEALKVPH